MMNWAPVRCSKADSFSFSACASLSLRMLALSVTKVVGGGGTSSASAPPATRTRRQAASRARTRVLPRSGGGCRRLISKRLEIHLGSGVRSRDAAEVCLRLESGHVRHNVGGKLQNRRVELLRDFVVTVALPPAAH